MSSSSGNNKETMRGKRKKNKENYKSNIIKRSRVKNDTYINHKGRFIQAREHGVDCRLVYTFITYFITSYISVHHKKCMYSLVLTDFHFTAADKRVLVLFLKETVQKYIQSSSHFQLKMNKTHTYKV